MKNHSLPSAVTSEIVGEFSDRALHILVNSKHLNDMSVGDLKALSNELTEAVSLALHAQVEVI